MGRNTGGGISLGDLVALFGRIPGALRRRSAERRHRKMMRKAPAYSLAAFPENTFGKIVGRVRPFDRRVLEAPISGRPCVYYEVAIDTVVEDSLLKTLATDQDAVSFLVEDESARGLVSPDNAVFSTEVDVMSTATMDDPQGRERDLLIKHGLAGKRVAFADGLRFRESVIELDELVAIYGGGVREPDPDAPVGGAYRDARPTRLCLTGTERFPLLVSDDPRSL